MTIITQSYNFKNILGQELSANPAGFSRRAPGQVLYKYDFNLELHVFNIDYMDKVCSGYSRFGVKPRRSISY